MPNVDGVSRWEGTLATTSAEAVELEFGNASEAAKTKSLMMFYDQRGGEAAYETEGFEALPKRHGAK